MGIIYITANKSLESSHFINLNMDEVVEMIKDRISKGFTRGYEGNFCWTYDWNNNRYRYNLESVKVIHNRTIDKYERRLFGDLQ